MEPNVLMGPPQLLNINDPGDVMMIPRNESIDGGGGNKTVNDGSFMLPNEGFDQSNQVCLPLAVIDSRVYSFGHFSGEDPLTFPFISLIFQACLVIIVARTLYYLLRPLKQPRIVCDIIGGMLIGPYFLGRLMNQQLYEINFFEEQSSNVPRTIAALGLLFYLFIIGVKMEPKMILQSGKKAWAVGVVSMVLPFTFVGCASYLFKESLVIRIARGRFFIFIVASVSVTAFPVLAEILTELNLLNSELGRLAMSSSMVHGLFGCFFMALFTVVNQSQGGAKLAIWSLMSLVGMVLVIVLVFRPWLNWIVRNTPKGGRVSDVHVSSILISVIVMAFVSDSIGASYVAGPLLMGLAVPEGPPLGSALVQRTSLLASEVLMPFLFLISGSYVDPAVLLQWKTWITMTTVLFLGFGVKVVGAMVPAVLCKIRVPHAFLLGLIMNFRGLVELISFLNFKNGELLGGESYTILVLSTVLMTSITVPLVSTLYKPFSHNNLLRRRRLQNLKPNMELRILACVHSEDPVQTIINLLEASSGTKEAPLIAFVLHLTELVGRANSTLIAHKNKKGYINPTQMDCLLNAFINYEQDKRGNVVVQPYTAIAPLKSMHQDICSLASDKNITFIILPFPRNTVNGMTEKDQAIRSNAVTILEQAPCSVGLLVYKGLSGLVLSTPGHFRYHIGVLFWGGPDDREGLAYAARTVRCPGISLSVMRFMLTTDKRDIIEQQLDDELVANVRTEGRNNEHFKLVEFVIEDLEQAISMIRSSNNNFDLLIVGRHQAANSQVEIEMAEWSECPELGVVGDMLSSSDFDCSFSLLVVQQ